MNSFYLDTTKQVFECSAYRPFTEQHTDAEILQKIKTTAKLCELIFKCSDDDHDVHLYSAVTPGYF